MRWFLYALSLIGISIGCCSILLEIIKGTPASDEDVMVSGFGKFSVNEKKERKARNPSTGEDMMLKERKVVTFKCSSKLRKRINSNYMKGLNSIL